MYSNLFQRTATTGSSAVPLENPSNHSIKRQEIVYFIQLYITTVLRQTFIDEEIDKAERAHIQRMKDNSRGSSNDDGNQFIPDMIQISKDANRKIKTYRSFIKRQSFFLDNILYKRATSMEEYCNIEDLEGRLDEIGRILNRRMMRVQET